MLVLFGAWLYKTYLHRTDPAYRWFMPALALKMLGGIALVCIYGYYYGGGDIFAYFDGTQALLNLTSSDPGATLSFLVGNNSKEAFTSFNFQTGLPQFYLYIDSNTWAVSRFSYPFVALGVGRILPATILMNVFAFIGPWKLFRLLNQRYSGMTGRIAIAILLIPSCIFWGSGMMKDGFTYAATLWLLYAAISIALIRRQIIMNVFMILINAYVIISIKPYIFIALMPAVLMLMLFTSVKAISSRILRYVIVPSATIIIVVGGVYLYSALSPSLGTYGNFDDALEKAAVSRDDFTQNQTYSGNYFDIGSFDPSIQGILSKAHLALLYGLFGPFPWQANNIVMYISSLEAMGFLILFLLAFRNLLFRGAFRTLVSDPILLSFLLFVFVFIVFVGVSTANFGSLVRYRIPALPMFVFVLFMLIKKRAEFIKL
jgi:hypothetical protein